MKTKLILAIVLCLVATTGAVDTMADGWWNDNGNISGCIGAWAAVGAANQAASYVDLNGTGNDLTEGAAAPTWASGTGWTFAGASSQYLQTGITPPDGTYTMLVEFANLTVSGTQAAFGGNGAGNTRFWALVVGSNNFANGGYFSSTLGGATEGNIAVAGSDGYFNAIDKGNMNAAWSGTGFEVYIGARNNAGSATNWMTGDILAAAIYNTTLSPTDIATITTAMGALGDSNNSGNFTYTSSIDGYTDLYAEYAYDSAVANAPIAVLMHGWSDATTQITTTHRERVRDRGLFVLVPGMRGRDGASGSRDASAKELYDIYDAIEYVKTNFADYVDATQIGIIGYSGGGGNALGFACKFPDYAQYIVSHFGMSDYGRDGTNGWYYNNGGSYTATIASSIGGTPLEVPDNYYARDATACIANVFTGGHLYLFHDEDDATVPIVHSQRVKDAFDAVPLVNYTANFTSSADGTRWTHGYNVPSTEDYWAADMAADTHAAWTVPTSGTVTAIGYMVTKRFSVTLGSYTDEAATVVYDTTTKQYTVTPLTTGPMSVTVTQGTDSVTRTISSQTTFYLSGGAGAFSAVGGGFIRGAR